MTITFTPSGGSAITLGTSALPTASAWGSLSGVQVDGVRIVQQRALIGAERVLIRARKNRARTLTFSVALTCATVADASTAAASLDANLPSGLGTLAIDSTSYTNAAIQRVTTAQIGVTVKATITVMF